MQNSKNNKKINKNSLKTVIRRMDTRHCSWWITGLVGFGNRRRLMSGSGYLEFIGEDAAQLIIHPHCWRLLTQINAWPATTTFSQAH